MRTFSDHSNRSLSIGFDVSPCLRYLLTGSEDGAVYVYDFMNERLLGKTRNAFHGDQVSDVSVNGSYLEYATACLDGHVRVFRDETVKKKTIVTTGKGGGQAE